MKNSILIVVLLFAFNCFAETMNQQIVSVNGTSTKFVNPNAVRKYLRIENRNAQDVYLKYGSAHVATEGVLIVKNTQYEVENNVPVSSIYLKSAAGSVDVGIIEISK